MGTLPHLRRKNPHENQTGHGGEKPHCVLPEVQNKSVIDLEPRVYKENSLEERISCGRTSLHGNWVKIVKNGFSVCLSSDGEKPFSQIKSKQMCLKILDSLKV